jgi:molybdate transport system ATP-binding protein
MIQFFDCDIKVSDQFSLKRLNWHVQSGETWVIVGPNGSGKSALAGSLAATNRIVAGDFVSNTENVAIVSLEEQARLIRRELERDDSDITDEVNHGTPVNEMLDEVCCDRALQSRLVDILKLGGLLDRGFRQLSTGETRKVLLTRALCSLPDLLVLDEPYEGLDVDTVPSVKALLSELAGRITLVLALNRVDEIPDFTTHALRLEHGRIAQQFKCQDGEQARQLLSQIDQIRSSSLSLPPSEPSPSVSSPQVPLNADGSLVSLKDGRVAYSDTVVFGNLNWTIYPGESWQVKGPNGSGKTCLLSLITGDHPQCYVNDLNLFGFKRGQGETIWQIKQFLGFVSTALHWDYRLSVGVRNVIVSGFYDSIGLYQKGTEQQVLIADAWLSLLELGKKATAPFSSLSYGEQRLVLIARAMIKHPPLLLLDEPCLGLDEANRQLVLALIQKICEQGSTTLVYVTHHDEDRIEAIGNELRLG